MLRYAVMADSLTVLSGVGRAALCLFGDQIMAFSGGWRAWSYEAGDFDRVCMHLTNWI